MKQTPGQTWIFLRGLSRESGHWGDFTKAFEKRFDCHVVVIDLPGTGEYFEMKSPFALNKIVDFVRAEWAKKKTKSKTPPNIFALSLGAMVAVRWMRDYPGEIGRGVLVNTSLRGLNPFFQRISPSAYFSLFRIFADRNAKHREALILKLTSQIQEWDDSELRARAELWKKHPVKRLTAVRQILAALTVGDQRQPLPQPVLLLNSLGDLLVHPDCSRRIARAWKAPLRRHAWAGHDLPLDDPKWTLNAIAEWLQVPTSPKSQSKA